MRIALAAVLAFALAGSAGAQSRTDRATDEIPLPSIGLPLPPIGLPLPPLGLSRPERSERFERSERSERFERPERPAGQAILFVPAFVWPYPYPGGTAVPTAPTPPRRAEGRIRLEIAFAVDPQIYVDNYYVGLLSDFSGGELPLDAGAHTIELVQDGYEKLRLSVQVSPENTTVVRGEMQFIEDHPSRAELAPPRPQGEAELASPKPPGEGGPAPSTIYMIPGCYVGNVPPKDASLPAGCDAARAIAFPSRP